MFAFIACAGLRDQSKFEQAILTVTATVIHRPPRNIYIIAIEASNHPPCTAQAFY
jgi:hypothetical protein